MFYFYQHQQYQGPYEHEELFFDGVKVEDVTVDRLMTFFEYFYSDLSNGVYVSEDEFETNSFEIRARQYRLNHKPFNYKITVSSEKPVEAFVKVFIGPKYDEYGRVIDINENRMNFFELDRFHYTLVAGQNIIDRSSHDSIYFSHDKSTYKTLYKQVMTAIKTGEEFKYFPDYYQYSFPCRFMLPKGDFTGKTYQFYVMVTPYHKHEETCFNKYVVDAEYSLGYPFDRPVEIDYDFYVPNAFFKDVVIYHKNFDKDISTKWSTYWL